MKFSLLALLAVSILNTPARAGTLTTRDGQTLTGDLSFTADSIKVTPKSGPAKTIPLKDVATADFNPAAPATPSREKPVEEKDKRRVFVEYFADADMTDRRLARYEPGFRANWNGRAVPDPLIPERVFARMTARLTPLVTEPHTFSIDCYGPTRLWVDGKLVLDKWGTGKKGNKVSVTVPLTAQQPALIRLDGAHGDINVFFASLSWTSRSGGQKAMWGDVLHPPDDTPAPRVTARTATPDNQTHFRAPPSITFEANVEHPAKIVRVDAITATQRLASTTSAPYRVLWDDPQPGVYKVKIRAVDEKGISGYSDPIDVSVAETGESAAPLPAPWGTLVLGKREHLLPGTASFANGMFTITKAGGLLVDGDDASQFVYQPVDGDFTLCAHLASLAPRDNLIAAAAGVMVRDGMSPQDRFVAACAAPDATTIVRRHDYWGNTSTGERLESQAAWLKLTRVDQHVRAYTSPDGVAWSLLGAADRLSLPDRVYVGLCAMARSRDTAATAAFDHVTLTKGPPALAHATPGILFRSGTFLAAEPLGLKNGKLTYAKSDGQRKTIADSDVARLVYKPVTVELAEKAPHDQSGVLMASGDFIDGEIKDLSYQVTISNTLFGRRTINIKYSDALAVYLKDAQPPSGRYLITTTDGSTYQSKSLNPAGDQLTIEDPSLGAVDLPVKEIARLRVN